MIEELCTDYDCNPSSIDSQRDNFHVNFVPLDVLDDRLIAQAYRPEIVSAMQTIKGKESWDYLGKIITKGVFQGISPQYAKSGEPCLKTRNVLKVMIDPCATDFINFEFAEKHPELKISAETILMNRSGAGSIGRAGIFLGHSKPFTNEHLYRFKAKNHDSAYIACFLNSWWGERAIEHGINGSTGQLQINQDSVKAIPVYLPEIELQKCIGDKIRKAWRLIELSNIQRINIDANFINIFGELDESLNRLKCYWASREHLSSYRINPTEYHPYNLTIENFIKNNHCGTKLKDALTTPDNISGGATPSGGLYIKEGIGFLRVQNVQPNWLDKSDLVFIDNDTDNYLTRSRIKPLDVVMTITGYPGTACCIQEDDLPLNINQHSVRFHLNDEWNPFFVAAFLNSPWGKAQVDRRSIGGTRDALDYPSVASIVLPKLSRDIQDEIGEHARQLANYLKESNMLLQSALSNVDKMINGTLDERKLLTEGYEVTRWLEANPNLYKAGGAPDAS